MRKLIIIGLDGATFDILDPYIKKGLLPNIDRMIRNGVKGKLESAIPPVTGPSWVSFMTGMWPGKHGIYDFVKPKPNSIKRQAVSYQDIRTPTLWDYLNKAGKKIGIVNLPITYPLPKVNGFIIPGLLTPNTEGEFAHPEGLMAELHQFIGQYVHDVWWQRYGESGIEKFLDELFHCTRQRIKTIFYLLEKKEWDIFTGVFIGTDRIQHYIWQYIYLPHEKQLTKREQRIFLKATEYYKQLDNFFGELLKKFSSLANIFIMSDHGFGPLRSKIYINRWLEENGYLTVNRKHARMLSLKGNILNAISTIVRNLDPWNLRKKTGIRKRLHRMSAYNFLDCIDWTRTIAYSASNTEQGIYLNLRGREPQGIVSPDGEYTQKRDAIITQLSGLKDPETGERIITQIYKREELYNGPYVENAPDIILFLKNGEGLIDVQLKETLYEKANWSTGFGTHRLDGIFIGYGTDIKGDVEITGAHIVDIAPTVIYQQGLDIPEEMDGKPLLEIFDEDFLKKHPVSYTKENKDDLYIKKEAVKILSNNELEAVEEKLKGLGYL